MKSLILILALILILGIFVNLASYSGVLLFLLMYTACFLPPEHNPLVDEHIIYALVLIILSAFQSGRFLGFGKRWGKFVKNRVLE